MESFRRRLSKMVTAAKPIQGGGGRPGEAGRQPADATAARSDPQASRTQDGAGWNGTERSVSWTAAQRKDREPRSAVTTTGAVYDDDEPTSQEDDSLRQHPEGSQPLSDANDMSTDRIRAGWTGDLLCGGRRRNAIFPD